MSAVKPMLLGLQDLLSKVHGGRYRVVRGPVSWAAWPFALHPFGCSVEIDDEPSVLPANVPGIRIAATFTFGARFDAAQPIVAWPSMDDTLLDEMKDDARLVLLHLSRTKGADNKPLIAALVADDRSRLIEFADIDAKSQGVICQFTVDV